MKSFSNVDVKLLLLMVPTNEMSLCSGCFWQFTGESSIVTEFLMSSIKDIRFIFIDSPSIRFFKRKDNNLRLLLNTFEVDLIILQSVTGSASTCTSGATTEYHSSYSYYESSQFRLQTEDHPMFRAS